MNASQLFDTHIVVDWSARSKPSPAKPTKDAIFWCAVRDGLVHQPEYARTRHDAKERLTALLNDEKRAGRRVLIGFDFPFGYPLGVAEHLTGEANALALWNWLDERIEDAADNANNRYAVATEINHTYPGKGPAWGRPASWPYPDIPPKASERTGNHPAERRLVDNQATGAKTVWQLAYAGSVGSQVLLGLPVLHALRDDLAATVWPFDSGLAPPTGSIVIAEVYPSLLQVQAHADRTKAEPLDAAQVRVSARAIATLDANGELGRLFSPDLSAEDRHTVETEEAWILGVGFVDELRAAA